VKHKLLYCLSLALLAGCSPDKPAEHAAAGPAPAAPSVATAAAPAASAPVDTLATYSWDSEMCHYTGRYNPRRYSKEALDNAYQLLYGSAMLTTNTSVFRPEDVNKLHLDSLTAEYTRNLRQYRTMRLLPQPLWQKLRQQSLQELEDDYRAKKLYIEAFADPAVLLADPMSANCQRYIQGLAAHRDSLVLRDWQRFVEEQKQRNGYDTYSERYNREFNSPDRLLYAKIDLLTFGWWNCMNASIRRVQPTEKMFDEFTRLFTDVKTECEDAD
jgi:hypothetical protein